MTIVVNLVGGAGVGKSRYAALLFSKLKDAGVNCELVSEYAKELAWEDRLGGDVDEFFVFAEQNRRLRRLKGKVDVIITDAPLYLKLLYKPIDIDPEIMDALVIDLANGYDNMNYMLKRVNPYNPSGREQTYEEARKHDTVLRELFKDYRIQYDEVEGSPTGVDKMFVDIMIKLADEKRLYVPKMSQMTNHKSLADIVSTMVQDK